ncbi:hypothetical protein LUZ63_009317 [Rhynchospora breviuscula]|uniref:SKP1-like protein n=1 Tax=Rhynchospora breviuscula TaxID=2022672 RepID=A0A9Q0CET7_9POAL|nr:hypothetical protein LUZ63_009317 [Rhynchospora breviuscula]
MATTNEGQKVRLQSSDGEFFEVDLAVAKKSGTIARWLEQEGEKDPAGFIPIQNVKGSVLAMFMEVDQDTIFDLIQAANYLDINGLLDLGCRTVAEMMKRKSIEQLRDTFNIKNDYSDEEEAALKEKHAWAFEKN